MHHGHYISPLRCASATVLLLMLALAGCEGKPAGATSNTAPSGAAASDTAATVAAAQSSSSAKPLPGAKTVALERAGNKKYDKTFDDLRFDIKPGDDFQRKMLPTPIEEMAGQRIRIRGFILPTPQKRGIKTFVLVRDNQECCFGPGAALYDCILVEMAPGKTAEYSHIGVAVEGTFDIQEVRGPDGKHLAIYHLAGESVR